LLKLTILFLVIPFLIITFFVKSEKKVDVKYTNDIIVRVKREDGSIEKIDLEKYITGVLAGEMPIWFHEEALKAQAVAARSYVMKRIEYSKDKDYDVVDTIMNQVYLDDNHLQEVWKENYSENKNKIIRAVMDTKNECVYYNNKIADTLFFSTSNGYTENSIDVFGFEAPYLVGVESTWDKEVSPVFEDKKEINRSDFCKILKILNCEKITINVLSITKSGRILELSINDKKFKGNDVKSLLNLRSNDFDINIKDNTIIINTKGYGHGVGMSQYGALAMAKKGYGYKEILGYYYKDTTIKKIN
jgi:stage II sporulation protein D